MIKQSLLAVAAMVAVSAFTSNANANPIYLGYSIGGGAITDFATADGTVAGAITVGSFTISGLANGQASGLPTSLFSNTLTVTSAAAGSITIYATEINNTARVATFNTGFSNDSQSSFSVQENSSLGLSNSKYSITTPYSMASLLVTPGMPTSIVSAPAPVLPTMYSLTEAYTINFTTAGKVNATMSVTSSVPEPLSIAVLGSGLAALGLIRRRKRV